MHAHYLHHSPTMLWFLTKTRKEGSEKLKNLSCHSINWIQVILLWRSHSLPWVFFTSLGRFAPGLSLASQDNHPLLLPGSVWGCTVPDVQSSLGIGVLVSIDATDFKLEIRRGNIVYGCMYSEWVRLCSCHCSLSNTVWHFIQCSYLLGFWIIQTQFEVYNKMCTG